MGKTKTAFVGEVGDKALTGEEKYKARQKQKEAAEKAKAEKVHIAGLKGGQRIVTIDAQSNQTAEETPEDIKKSAKGPKKRSKKYLEAKAKIDSAKTYSLKEAIKLVKETSYSKFDGSVEMHLNVKKTGMSVNITLPNSAGKEKKIEVADDKTIEKLQKGKIDFDVLLATAEMMPKLVQFAKLLGPRGLMPNPKTGTLLKSVKDAAKFSGNRTTLKTQKDFPLIHTTVGKVSQKESELEENIEAVVNAIGAKNITKAFLNASMSPAIKIAV